MYYGDKIDPVTVFESHGWICHICETEIDKTLRCPDKMAATMDHIKPLSKGGRHVWENVAPAHWICNIEKADSEGLDNDQAKD